MISLLRGTCWRCEYQATIGIGRDDGATVPVDWASANCPTCGMVSVNVADVGSGDEARCHECGAIVELYSRSGVMPEPAEGRRCPECDGPTLAFSPAGI